MSTVTSESTALRAVVVAHRDALEQVLERYGATNPRVFGSVARGDATADSDVDLLVDLLPDLGNPLLRVAGMGEELSDVFGRRVDVVTPTLLRAEVSSTALSDAVPV